MEVWRRRFIDVAEEDIKLVGVREEDYRVRQRGVWPPLEYTAQTDRRY